MNSRTKIEIAMEAFLIVATLVGVIALVSAVHRTDNSADPAPVNGTSIRN